jgi:hypothetical protein
MDWLLEHPQIIILIAFAVVGILQRLRRAGDGEAPPAPPPPTIDPEATERTRQIQEEIRRRILERRALEQEAAAPPEPAPPPVAASPVVTRAPAPSITSAPELAPMSQPSFSVPLLPLVPISSFFPTGRGAASVPVLPLDLHDPGSLRRAVVLREILGPPVGLR